MSSTHFEEFNPKTAVKSKNVSNKIADQLWLNGRTPNWPTDICPAGTVGSRAHVHFLSDATILFTNFHRAVHPKGFSETLRIQRSYQRVRLVLTLRLTPTSHLTLESRPSVLNIGVFVEISVCPAAI